jgi:hypothetical protein
MDLSPALSEALLYAETALAGNANGELVLPARKRIWAAMGPRELNGPKAIIGPPLRRRTGLAGRAVRYVLPIWHQAFPGNDGPERMVADARVYLQQRMQFISASDSRDRFWAELDNLGGVAVAVGYAAARALTTALSDEAFDLADFDSSLDEDLDMYRWDAGYYAAIAAADGAPWEATSNRDARREFWQWYIRDAAPAAWAAEERRSTGAANA